MSDVVITLEDPDSTYNRWLRGEDIAEAHILSEERRAELREEALNRPVDEDMQHASRSSGPDAPSLGVGFDSMDYTEAGVGSPGPRDGRRNHAPDRHRQRCGRVLRQERQLGFWPDHGRQPFFDLTVHQRAV